MLVDRFARLSRRSACSLLLAGALAARADETCQSPYLPRLVGQEDFVYVWTLGIEGVGDGSDKLVTVGANPDARGLRKVVSSVSVGGRHEAHHGGPTDDRRHLWVGGLDDSRIFIFDVASDPAHPKLVTHASATSPRRPEAWWAPTASTRSRAAC